MKKLLYGFIFSLMLFSYADAQIATDQIYGGVYTKAQTDATVEAGLRVDASGFDGNLATTDDTVQKVAQKLDDLDTSAVKVITVDGDSGTTGSTVKFVSGSNVTITRTDDTVEIAASGGGSTASSLTVTAQENISAGDIVRVYNDGTGYNKAYKVFNNTPFTNGSIPEATPKLNIVDASSVNSSGYFIALASQGIATYGSYKDVSIWLLKMTGQRAEVISKHPLSSYTGVKITNTAGSKVARLSDTQFAVIISGFVYQQASTDNNFGIACSLSGSTLSVGNPVMLSDAAFTGASAYSVMKGVAANTVGVLLCRNSSNPLVLMFATVSGTTWTWGAYNASTSVVTGTGFTPSNQFSFVKSAPGIITVASYGMSGTSAYVCSCSWSGTSVTAWGSVYGLPIGSGTNAQNPVICSDENGYIMVAYAQQVAMTSNELAIVVGTISGTSITLGTPVKVNTADGKPLYYAQTAVYSYDRPVKVATDSWLFPGSNSSVWDSTSQRTFIKATRSGTTLNYELIQYPLTRLMTFLSFNVCEDYGGDLCWYNTSTAVSFFRIFPSISRASSELFLIGVADTTATTGNSIVCSFPVSGSITNNAWSLNTGTTYYVDPYTSGLTTSTAGTTQNKVGIATSSNSIMIPQLAIGINEPATVQLNTAGYIWRHTQF